MTGTAVFSECRRYRYRLTRTWDGSTLPLVRIMLNPSTADEYVLDPTIRRCVGFSAAAGYGGVEIYNLFAFRSTDPTQLLRERDPVGPDNERYIRSIRNQHRIIAGWGVVKRQLIVKIEVIIGYLEEKRKLECLGVTAGGHPKHPLYVPYKQQFVDFSHE